MKDLGSINLQFVRKMRLTHHFFYLNVEKCKIKKQKLRLSLKKIQKQIKRRREMNKRSFGHSKKIYVILAEVKIGGWKDLNSIKFKRPFLGTKTYIYCESIILIFII